PPKATGCETFGDNEGQALIDECIALGMSKYDNVATITRITAQNIIKQYRTFLPRYNIDVDNISKIYMCGSGSRNLNIINYLREQLPNIAILKLDEMGVHWDRKEAISSAQQALKAILGPHDPRPSQRRHDANTISGKIAPGLQWREVMAMALEFGKVMSCRPTVKEMVVDRQYTAWKQ
ncbi:hypothetical protein M432DRAFT_550030, partial [Thermoascus aurantiacus ATCC 26904]